MIKGGEAFGAGDAVDRGDLPSSDGKTRMSLSSSRT
jgi:hypothetical protein